jgi:hypothetical protein
MWTISSKLANIITEYVVADSQVAGVCTNCYFLRSLRIIRGVYGRLQLYRAFVAWKRIEQLLQDNDMKHDPLGHYYHHLPQYPRTQFIT